MSETNVTYYVTRERPCPECQGVGLVTHPRWQALYDLKGERLTGVTPENIEMYFRAEGFDYPPDEEIPCHECDGTGIVRDTVPLAHAMADLMGSKGGDGDAARKPR